MTRKSKTEVWLLLSMLGAALCAGFLVPTGLYEALGLLVWLSLCGWNVRAYFGDMEMFGFGAANMPSGNEPARRRFTFWLTITAYFMLVGIYIFKYFA